MPPTIGRRPRDRQLIELPSRVAHALDPSLERSTIPSRVMLGTNAVPYAGETREEQFAAMPPTQLLAVGAVVSLGSLRRAWKYVGIMVDPGNAAAAGLVARLRVFGAGMNGVLPAVAITFGGGPQAFPATMLGARAELIVINGTAAPVRNVRGLIWGMSES